MVLYALKKYEVGQVSTGIYNTFGTVINVSTSYRHHPDTTVIGKVVKYDLVHVMDDRIILTLTGTPYEVFYGQKVNNVFTYLMKFCTLVHFNGVEATMTYHNKRNNK